MNHDRPTRLLRALSCLLLSVPAAFAFGQDALEPAQREQLDRLADDLASTGLTVDLEAVTLSVRPRAELRAAVLEDLRAELGDERADLWRRMLQDRGRAWSSGEDLLAALATARTKQRAALYRPAAGELALVAESLGELESGAHDTGVLVSLAQLARHQSGAGVFAGAAPLEGAGAEPDSFDALTCRRAVIQGGALADAARALEARGEDPAALGWLREHHGGELDQEFWRAGLDTLEAAMTDEVRLRLWSHATSSETLVHPLKRGADEPSQVPLPPWPEKAPAARLVSEDTLGELGVRALLLEHGAPRVVAEAVGIGWDGDRVRHYVTDDGQHVLLWRTVWDRAEDARTFAEEWRRRSGGQVRLGGRVVDWVLADEKGIWNKVLKAFDAFHHQGQASDSDARSSGRIEEDLLDDRATAAYVVANEWRHPRLDLTVEVPVGWYEDEEDGRTFMIRERSEGFHDNVHVVQSPNPDAATLDGVLQVNEKRLRADPLYEFISAEKRELGEQEVGLLRYSGKQGGHEIIYSTLVVLREGEQVGVTVAFEQSRWEEYHQLVDLILASVRLGPVPPRDE